MNPGIENLQKQLQKIQSVDTSISDKLLIVQTKRNEILKEISNLQTKTKNIEDLNMTLEKVIHIFTQAATVSRDNARKHFEKIITDALQFVSQSKDYEFVIQELTGRAKASYEFYIKSTVNGVECIQKPEDANGGGFVDIISLAAKYAYLEIFNDPKIMNDTLLYDEPGKMISEQMSIKFAEYIKFLGTHYDRQTIMVTHNDNLSNVADKTFIVTKDTNGVSQASTLVPTVNFWDLLDTSVDMEVLHNEN
jgi:DNA repair ATPase RecN